MTKTNFNIAFVLFPYVTQLDFTGPLQVLSRLPGASIHLAAQSLEPVPTDAVLTLNPTCTFDDCPPADVLCIPGGFGIDDAILNPTLMAFVRKESARAKYVTSVCTGAFVLGAAGVLKGKKATTHWAYHDALTDVGAIPVRERVVRDGNIFTGGGVTAGIDFAFTLVTEIAGEAFAKELQLGLEYDPAPPFDAGSPVKAAPEALKRMTAFYGDRGVKFRANLAEAMTNN